MTVSHDSLRRHMAALRELARSPSWKVGSQRAGFEALAVVAARTLEVARASVWLYDDTRQRIHCAELYSADEDQHSSGHELGVADFPPYFAALAEARIIDACDAANDPRTSSLGSGYLEPVGVDALLDAPIFVGGQCVGVVCHEHRGGPRSWTPEEQVFAAAMGDFAALVIETTQRRAAETLLRQRDEELRRTLEAATVGVWSWNRETDAIDWTGETERMFGPPLGQITDLEGVLSRVHPDDREGVQRAMRATLDDGVEREYEVEFRVVWPDQSIHWLTSRGGAIRDEEGKAIGLRGTTIDVTEHKRIEEQLQRSQKLEGIGRLAGGIAHDFNNLLTVIRCSVGALRQPLATMPRAAEHLENIEQSSRRAADLVAQLLAFARKQPQRSRVVEVGGLVRGTASMLRHLLAAPIDLEVVTAPEPMMVRADPAYLEQILLDLVLNARDSMPDGGRLRITTSRQRGQDLRDDGWDLGPEHEDAAVLEVSDTGIGIPEHILPRIFEPFFTTKELGTGSGMGLASTYGIVHQAGGDVRVSSTPGAGTTVRIVWPLLAASELGDQVSAATPLTRTILLIEDEELIRNVAGIILREAGYAVLSASSGEQAVNLARATESPIDLILTDAVLPGLRGAELVRIVRAMHPAAPVLFMSGYAESSVADPSLADTHFLAKPFNPEDLLARLDTILSETGP